MSFLFGQVDGGFFVSWTVATLSVLGTLVALVFCGFSALVCSGDQDKRRFVFSTIGFFSLLMVVVASLLTTFWINVHEVGITQTQLLKTGVHPYRTEGGLQIPLNGSLLLVNAANIGEVSVNWYIEQPEKLVPYYQEIRSFSEGGNDEWTFRNWVSMKLLKVTPKSRELLLPVEESTKMNEDFAREVQKILGEYGLKTRIFVSKNFVIDLGDPIEE